MAVASATPAARSRGAASPAAARRALATVTAVDETRPPAAAASSTPWLAPKILRCGVSEEGDRGEHDGDGPDLAQVDAAERTDRLVGDDRQRDERHRQEDEPGAQLLPGNLLEPPMQVLPHGQQSRGRHRSRSRDAQVAEDRVSAEREGCHAGNRRGGGEASGLRFSSRQKAVKTAA